MRGKHKLFNNVIGDPVLLNDQQHVGTGNELINQRNELIVNRYYYHLVYKKSNYETILNSLRMEFFLKQRTIVKIIDSRVDLLKQLREEKPTIKMLADKYPSCMLSW